ITHPDDPDDGIAFGTAQGFLCIWRRTRGEEEFQEIFCSQLAGGVDGQEISAIAYDTKSNQLAMRPTNIKSIKVAQHYPQAVAFGRIAALGPEIWSFRRDDGEIHILDEAGKVIKTKTTGAVMGHAAINIRDDVFIIDDVVQGVALYKLGNIDRVKTFQVPTEECRSRNVCFLGDGSIIVTGSDHGKVYAFERRTGDIYDVIDIGAKDWVQSLTVSWLCKGFIVTIDSETRQLRSMGFLWLSSAGLVTTSVRQSWRYGRGGREGLRQRQKVEKRKLEGAVGCSWSVCCYRFSSSCKMFW
ncbi:hypothetical protein L218DRAFT_853173, partial [Marasmius fiardii PR-910]